MTPANLRAALAALAVAALSACAPPAASPPTPAATVGAVVTTATSETRTPEPFPDLPAPTAPAPGPTATVAAPPGTSGIVGNVFIGPACPVVRVDTPCPDLPFQAVIAVVDAAGREVARALTDRAGHFEIALPPGHYTLLPQAPNPGAPPRAASVPVAVAPGRFSPIEVHYDSGIR